MCHALIKNDCLKELNISGTELGFETVDKLNTLIRKNESGLVDIDPCCDKLSITNNPIPNAQEPSHPNVAALIKDSMQNIYRTHIGEVTADISGKTLFIQSNLLPAMNHTSIES